MSTILVNNIKDTGNNTLLTSDGSGNVTLGSGFPNNTPAFQAQISVTQAVPTGVYTKIQFNNEIFDTNSAYDNSTNYRFTAPSAGKYLFNANAFHAAGTTTRFTLKFYKNGSNLNASLSQLVNGANSTDWSQNISSIIDLSVDDYVEVYVNHDRGSNSNFELGQFEGFKLIGA